MADLKTMEFPVRNCPYCGSDQRNLLFNLEVNDFCVTNWTYTDNFREILGLPDEAIFPIDHCSKCGFIYARYELSKDFLDIVYEKVIRGSCAIQASQNKSNYARRMRYVSQLIQLSPIKNSPKALDYGCGFGATLSLLSGAGVTAIGLDTSLSRVSHIQNLGIRVFSQLVEVEEFAPYEILVCDNVLEHVPDPRLMVQQLASMCLQDSILYMSVPSYEQSIVEQLQKDHALGQLQDKTLNPWEHLNYFDLMHLDGLLEEENFIPLKRYELVEHVDVGLRSEINFNRRFKNGLASIKRIITYMVKGTVGDNTEDRFYRYCG